MKLLKNMERFKLTEPLFEAVRVVLSYRGEEYSPAYIQGISGRAFRVGVSVPVPLRVHMQCGQQNYRRFSVMILRSMISWMSQGLVLIVRMIWSEG